MIRYVAALVAVWALASPVRSAALEDFASGSAVTDIAMSDSGRYVAVAGPGAKFGDNQIQIVDLAAGSGKTVAMIPLPGVDLAGVAWKGDTRLIAKIVKRDVEVSGVSKRHPLYGRTIPIERTIAMDPDGSNPIVLFGESRRMIKRAMMGQPIASMLPDDPDHILMSAFDGTAVHLYKVNVQSGDFEKVERGESSGSAVTIDWQADAEGYAWLRTYAYRGGVGAQIRAKGGKWRNIWQHFDTSDKSVEFMPLALSEDGQGFYAAMRSSADDRMGLFLVPLEEGGAAKRIFSHPAVDIGADHINNSGGDFAVFNQLTGRLNGVRYAADAPAVHFINANWGKAQALLEEAYPGHSVLIVSHARNFSKAVVQISASATPPVYMVFDAGTSALTTLAAAYPGLAGAPLGQTRSIVYPSRDGTQIKALLTTPAKSGPHPLVVLAHGGPEARDIADFNPLFVQSLVASGYAVIQPQFRGSGGYGKAWADAGRLKWGTAVLDDVAAAADYAVGQGIAAKNRVCVVGWSFGGYAALASAAFRPGTFACAAGGAGVYDLVEMLRHERDVDGEAAYEYWAEQIGRLTSNNAAIEAISPARNAAAIKIPVLLMSGDDDEVVPITQTELMAAALKASGNAPQVVVMKGEGHNIERYESRLLYLLSLLPFLEANIGR